MWLTVLTWALLIATAVVAVMWLLNVRVGSRHVARCGPLGLGLLQRWYKAQHTTRVRAGVCVWLSLSNEDGVALSKERLGAALMEVMAAFPILGLRSAEDADTLRPVEGLDKGDVPPGLLSVVPRDGDGSWMRVAEGLVDSYFDTSDPRQPLWRAVLVSDQSPKCEVILVFHHMLVDGACCSVCARVCLKSLGFAGRSMARAAKNLVEQLATPAAATPIPQPTSIPVLEEFVDVRPRFRYLVSALASEFLPCLHRAQAKPWKAAQGLGAPLSERKGLAELLRLSPPTVKRLVAVSRHHNCTITSLLSAACLQAARRVAQDSGRFQAEEAVPMVLMTAVDTRAHFSSVPRCVGSSPQPPWLTWYWAAGSDPGVLVAGCEDTLQVPLGRGDDSKQQSLWELAARCHSSVRAQLPHCAELIGLVRFADVKKVLSSRLEKVQSRL